MLAAYQAQFQNLIQYPAPPTPLISNNQATVYINAARGQVALEAECIRVVATLAIVPGTQQYPFSAISFPTGTEGVQGVQDVRLVNYGIAAGQQRVIGREWEWFNRYVLANPVPVPGVPALWAQYGQGANGTLFVNQADTDYTLYLDTVCYPMPLVDDTTPEAIPYQWTDAVPFWAAWLGFLSLTRQTDADKMMANYRELVQRARRGATPSVLPHQFEQSPDMTLPNKLGVQPAGRRG